MEMIVASIYGFLFLTGLVSNIWVLIVIVVVSRSGRTGCTNVLFYTVTLTCVNLLVLTTIPATVADLVVGYWVLPDALCPLYWTIELLNKIASSLIVASIAIACYFGVCRSRSKSMYKCGAVAAVHIGAISIVVAWKSIVVWQNSEVYYIADNEENDTFGVYGRKCIFEPDFDERTTFTSSAFIAGYLIPVLFMVLSYAAILRKVYSQSQALSRRGMRQFQCVAKSASILIIFYFFCWSPYWCTAMILSILPDHSQLNEVVGNAAFCFHALPMLNCAYSPLIYTLLNRHLRAQYRTAISKPRPNPVRKTVTTTYL